MASGKEIKANNNRQRLVIKDFWLVQCRFCISASNYVNNIPMEIKERIPLEGQSKENPGFDYLQSYFARPVDLEVFTWCSSFAQQDRTDQ